MMSKKRSSERYKKLAEEYEKQFPKDGFQTIGALLYHFGSYETEKILEKRKGREIKLRCYPEEKLDYLEYYYE